MAIQTKVYAEQGTEADGFNDFVEAIRNDEAAGFVQFIKPEITVLYNPETGALEYHRTAVMVKETDDE
jgi:hypothetical protein